MCSSDLRVPAVPSEHDFSEVEVVGVPDVRYDIFTKGGINELVNHFYELQQGYIRKDNTAAFLSISGVVIMVHLLQASLMAGPSQVNVPILGSSPVSVQGHS